MRVLLVEDDRLIGEGVRAALVQDGYAADWLRDGAEADAALKDTRFDIVLLDLGLPGLSGLDVLRRLRRRNDRTPVIILSARDEVRDRIAGLDAGADDYLVKPFDLDELAARMRVALRRREGRGVPAIEYGDIVLDPASRSVAKAGKPVTLSPREYAVLEALLQRPGIALSRQQLEDRIYGWDDEIGSNAVEVYVHSLRRKLGADLIRTLRGVGYCIPKAS